MGILVKSTVWASLLLLAVPFGGGDGSVGPFQAIGAAREAIGDLAGLCERKPDVCDTGRAAFRTVAVRAQEASRIAIALLDNGEPSVTDSDVTVEGIIAATETDSPDEPVTTGSVPSKD